MNEIKLPHGVLFDGTLYQTAYLNEITGKQQNYLVNTKYKSPVDHIEHLLFDLLVDLKDDNNTSILPKVDKRHLITKLMQVEDIQLLLIKLRETSFGDDYYFESLKCPHCGAKNNASLKLSTLEIKRYPKPEKTVHMLPKSKLEIEYKAMNLSDLKRLGSDQERLMNNHVTETMLTILKRLGDKYELTATDVEDLPALDNKFIAENAPAQDHVDDTITHECTSCKTDFDFNLGEMTPDFFALSRT
jgi:hypothetical protein